MRRGRADDLDAAVVDALLNLYDEFDLYKQALDLTYRADRDKRPTARRG